MLPIMHTVCSDVKQTTTGCSLWCALTVFLINYSRTRFVNTAGVDLGHHDVGTLTATAGVEGHCLDLDRQHAVCRGYREQRERGEYNTARFHSARSLWSSWPVDILGWCMTDFLSDNYGKSTTAKSGRSTMCVCLMSLQCAIGESEQ